MYYGPVCLLAYSTWTLISSILSNCCWWMYSSCIQWLSNNTSTRKLSKISEIGHIHSKEIHLMIKRVSSYCKIGNTKVDQHVVSVQIFKEAFVRRHKISEEFLVRERKGIHLTPWARSIISLHTWIKNKRAVK